MKVIDASFAVKLVVPEAGTDDAHRLWAKWVRAGEPTLAPPLFDAETASALRRRVYREVLDEIAGAKAFDLMRGLEIEIVQPAGLYERAWQLARDFNRPTVYDCCYLALADLVDAEFWTADEKLSNAIGDRFPLMRLLGDSTS